MTLRLFVGSVTLGVFWIAVARYAAGEDFWTRQVLFVAFVVSFISGGIANGYSVETKKGP